MKAYTYRHRKTGKKIQSDTPMSSKEYVLVTRVQDMQMRGGNIISKH